MTQLSQPNSLPIGVFDSGMGGLTVLDALKTSLPNESFIYLGDTARLPYGTKSPHTVTRYAEQMARILVEQRIKALVIACNTATTAALPYLQAQLSYMPVIGVVEPGAKAAVAACHHGLIRLLATETTVASQAYQSLIHQFLPHASVEAIVCGLLVSLAEEGLVNHCITKDVLRYYLHDVADNETILLGCTHFPVFKQALQEILPPGVNVVDSAIATADAVKQVLTQHHLCHDSNRSGDIHYLVTDSIERFKRIGAIFIKHDLENQLVTLVDTPSAIV